MADIFEHERIFGFRYAISWELDNDQLLNEKTCIVKFLLVYLTTIYYQFRIANKYNHIHIAIINLCAAIVMSLNWI